MPSGAIETAGDELTGEQMATVFGAVRERPSRFEALSADGLDEDNQKMFEWLSHLPAYQADFIATKRLQPEAMSFDQWVRTTG